MTVAEILSSLPPHKDGNRLPVVFNGSREPRLLGWARDIYAADNLAVVHHVSATFCSLAEFGGRRFLSCTAERPSA